MHEKLLLYYRLTGIELSMPLCLRRDAEGNLDRNGEPESEEAAQKRVINETMVLTANDKARLLRKHAASALQWQASMGDGTDTGRCAIRACSACGLRDPEMTDYQRDVPIEALPPWAKMGDWERELREMLGSVWLIESIRTGKATWRSQDLRLITSTYQAPDGTLYHLHHDLVDNDRTVTLCRYCYRAVNPPKLDPPKLSIAAGIDFGAHQLLGLPEPSELEMLLLSDVREYRLTLKVAVLDDPKAPRRQQCSWQHVPLRRAVRTLRCCTLRCYCVPRLHISQRRQLRGHLITFGQDGVEATARALGDPRRWMDEACAWVRDGGFTVAFVGPEGEFDLLRLRLALVGPLRARPDVVYNWLVVRDRIAEVYQPERRERLKLPSPDEIDKFLEDLARMLQELPQNIVDNAVMINDASLDEEQARRAADIANVREPGRLLVLPELEPDVGTGTAAPSSQAPHI